MTFWKTIYNHFLDFIFPVACVNCHKEGTYLCISCIKKIPRLDRQRCLVCQKPSPFGKTHTDCAKTKIDGIISALPYHDTVIKKLISTYKYNFVDLSDILGQFIIEEIRNQELNNFFKDFIIVPVPLHKRRLRWRGFNQSLLLAQKLSVELQLPISTDLIARTRYTRPQIELKHDERKENIKGAFAVNESVENKKILIIDDVVTTGSTLNELARILKKKNAHSVWAITLAAD